MIDDILKAKKAYKQVEIDGNVAVQVFNYDKFRKNYEKWKAECNVSGEQLHMKSSRSLLDLVASHGKVARFNREATGKGAGSVIETLDNLITDAEVMEYRDVTDIRTAYKNLAELQNTKEDPRNILFTDIKFVEVNRDTGDYDEANDVEEIHGHYRTQNYNNYRNLLADIHDDDKSRETIPPVPTDWYSTQENQAKPPMWQALFAKGGGGLVSKGLMFILKEALDIIKGIKIEHLKLRIRDSGAGTTAAELMEIPSVNEWIKEAIGDKENPGWGINKQTGMFKDDSTTRRMTNFAFITDDMRESKMVKRVAGYEDIVGAVKGFTIIISRRQMKNLAILTGGCKRTPGKETVYMPGIGTALKKSNDWRKVLAW